MINNINIRRVKANLKELFEDKIDMRDFPENQSKHFETRTLAAVALMMMAGIDVPQASIHITDGYHDMGIDAIYLDESQKKLFVIQSKWREKGTGGISQEEISTFAQGIEHILAEDLEGANAKIMAKQTDVDKVLTKMDYQIHAIFIHTGDQKISSYAERPISDLLKRTNDDVSTILLFDEINFKDVYNFLANGQDQAGIDIDDVILSNWGKIETPFVSYYGTISATMIGEWYKEFGNKLFAKNIRFYKGNTDVNEGMKKVLMNEPDKFYYYNNGIKLLCKSIKRKAKDSTTNTTGLFALEGVSLVNGAQTTGTIGSLYMEKPDQISKAMVMIQIIDLSNVDTETSTQITRLSNTQNRIENKDFAALDPEQERIRMELMFSHYAYLYKSGDRITNLDKQISFDEAIIALACRYSDISYAVTAKGNVGTLSEDITKTPYKALMNPSTNSFVLLNSVLYMREVENYLQTKKEQAKNNRERLVCIHANRFILHFVLLSTTHEFETAVIEKENIREEIKGTVDVLVEKTTQLIDEIFADSYPANIFKNISKCKTLKEKLRIRSKN